MTVFQIFLIGITFIVSCRCQCELSKFKTFKIVPDVLKNMPEKELQVTFFNQVFECGSNIGYFLSVMPPPLQYDADDKNLYTLIMLDADVPFPDLNISFPLLHWLVVNIPGNKVKEGETVANYIIPTPPPFFGPHRYIIQVFQQQEEIDPFGEHPMRFSFDANTYANSHNLQGPVYGYFFLVGNSLKSFGMKLLSNIGS